MKHKLMDPKCGICFRCSCMYNYMYIFISLFSQKMKFKYINDPTVMSDKNIGICEA